MKNINWEDVKTIALVIIVLIVSVCAIVDGISDYTADVMKRDMVESMVEDIESSAGYSTKVVELTEVGRSVWEDGIDFYDLDNNDYIIIVYNNDGMCIDKIAV